MFGNDKYVVALLHCQGYVYSNTYTDSAYNGGHTWTAYGAHSPPHVWVENNFYKFGERSLYFDELTSPGYAHLETPYSTDFNFETGDFTWDMWVKNGNFGPGATYGTGFFCVGGQTDNNNRVALYQYNKGGGGAQYNFFFKATVGGVEKANYNTPYTTFSFPSSWYHIAAVRNGTNFYIFLNGVSQTLTVTTAISTNSITLATNEKTAIGFADMVAPFPPQLPWDMNGWMDEIRISKGIARWTSNFTVPSSAYSDVSHWFPPHRLV